MFNKMKSYMTTPVMFLFVCFFILFLVFVLPLEAIQMNTIAQTSGPDTMFTYSIDQLNQIAETMGTTGRDYYIRSRFTFDVAWPIVYTLFLFSTLTWLIARLKYQNISFYKKLPLAALIGMLFDFLENIFASVYFYTYPNSSIWIGTLSSISTTIKWLWILLAFLALFGLLLIYTFKAIRRSSYDKNWMFSDVKNSAVFTTNQIINNKIPILYVCHDDDGAWQFHNSAHVDVEEAMIVSLAEIVELDQDICELYDLPLGWVAFRKDVKEPWIRHKR